MQGPGRNSRLTRATDLGPLAPAMTAIRAMTTTLTREYRRLTRYWEFFRRAYFRTVLSVAQTKATASCLLLCVMFCCLPQVANLGMHLHMCETFLRSTFKRSAVMAVTRPEVMADRLPQEFGNEQQASYGGSASDGPVDPGKVKPDQDDTNGGG